MIVESQVVTWFVSAALIVAAVIDGFQRRVPNWLTFPLAAGGLALAGLYGGGSAFLAALGGLGLGLLLLLPLYAIGGMGAGDVKLLAALGAWTGAVTLFWSFTTGVVIGAVIAVVMVLYSRRVFHHIANCQTIAQEVITIRDPVQLSKLAAARKPGMLLLPYGIPLTLGALAYFAWRGMFI